jgi:hypothetical protein
VIGSQPLPDEDRNRVDVAIHLLIGLRITRRAVRSRQHPAVAGADRADEHQIGEVDPAVGVLFQPRRHARERPIPRRGNGQRPDGGNVQKNARPARPAVDQEGYRARCRIGTVLNIVDLGAVCIISALVPQRRARGMDQRGEAGQIVFQVFQTT